LDEDDAKVIRRERESRDLPCAAEVEVGGVDQVRHEAEEHDSEAAGQEANEQGHVAGLPATAISPPEDDYDARKSRERSRDLGKSMKDVVMLQ